MEHGLLYGTYAAAGGIALAVYCGLPKARQPSRPALTVILSALALGGLVLLLGRLLGAAAEGRFYFCVLSVLAVLAAIRVVTHPRPVYSALYFVGLVLSTAALIVMTGAQFLAAALVIIYAGAILVTYVFVIMMAQQSSPGPGGSASVLDYDRSAREPAAAVLAGFVLIAAVAGVIVRHNWPTAKKAAQTVAEVGNTLALGRELLSATGFAIAVEVAGVLLMVAMVGAIVIARRRLPRAKEEIEPLPPGEMGRRVKPF
ncbi:MAG TPA: NADH-quinone oxidoreductase subunit J [Phycisphaerae bacterium]|nr:NADH-quinone oxidoreductase subunit J [Phycisphaerae bacterium]